MHTLPEEESNHCVRVLRLQDGDEMLLTDGGGTMYTGRIEQAHPKACKVRIIQSTANYQARPYRLQMAVAPTKNMERFEWFVEKATEVGVDEIIPLICDHSERKICKTDRSERIAVAALKQCKRAQLPVIQPACTFSAFMEQLALTPAKPGDLRAVPCCWVDTPRVSFISLLAEAAPRPVITVLIGPEGDFSAEEVALAQKNGFKAVSLGESILRTETAALYAVMGVAAMLGATQTTCR